MIALLRSWLGALAAVLIFAAPPSAAEGRTLGREPSQCLAVAPVGMLPPDPAFRCGAQPAGYQDAVFWLRFNLAPADSSSGAPVLLVHQTRFDRLTVLPVA